MWRRRSRSREGEVSCAPLLLLERCERASPAQSSASTCAVGPPFCIFGVIMGLI